MNYINFFVLDGYSCFTGCNAIRYVTTSKDVDISKVKFSRRVDVYIKGSEK